MDIILNGQKQILSQVWHKDDHRIRYGVEINIGTFHID